MLNQKTLQEKSHSKYERATESLDVKFFLKKEKSEK